MSTRASAFRLDYVKTIGIVNNGFNGRGFANPSDLVVGNDGRMFVLNRCDPARASAIRVGVLNFDEEYLGEFGYGRGRGDGQFVLPVAIAMDSNERIYVTDEYNHRVTVFDASGTFLAKWGVLGSGDGDLNGPAGIAIDSDDKVYVVDQNNGRVQAFTTRGEYISQWGTIGSASGEFNLPWGISVDSEGGVYVADWRNDRIQKFTAEGRYVATYGTTGQGDGQLSRPSSVAVDDDGYIYIADWGNERVQVLDPDGRFQLKLRGQATLSKWAAEYYVSNPEEKATRDISKLISEMPPHFDNPYDTASHNEPYFWGPISVKLDRQRRLYVTESSRHRIQIYERP